MAIAAEQIMIILETIFSKMDDMVTVSIHRERRVALKTISSSKVPARRDLILINFQYDHL
jgi:hypothetical protein